MNLKREWYTSRSGPGGLLETPWGFLKINLLFPSLLSIFSLIVFNPRLSWSWGGALGETGCQESSVSL